MSDKTVFSGSPPTGKAVEAPPPGGAGGAGLLGARRIRYLGPPSCLILPKNSKFSNVSSDLLPKVQSVDRKVNVILLSTEEKLTTSSNITELTDIFSKLKVCKAYINSNMGNNSNEKDNVRKLLTAIDLNLSQIEQRIEELKNEGGNNEIIPSTHKENDSKIKNSNDTLIKLTTEISFKNNPAAFEQKELDLDKSLRSMTMLKLTLKSISICDRFFGVEKEPRRFSDRYLTFLRRRNVDIITDSIFPDKKHSIVKEGLSQITSFDKKVSHERILARSENLIGSLPYSKISNEQATPENKISVQEMKIFCEILKRPNPLPKEKELITTLLSIFKRIEPVKYQQDLPLSEVTEEKLMNYLKDVNLQINSYTVDSLSIFSNREKIDNSVPLLEKFITQCMDNNLTERDGGMLLWARKLHIQLKFALQTEESTAKLNELLKKIRKITEKEADSTEQLQPEIKYSNKSELDLIISLEEVTRKLLNWVPKDPCEAAFELKEALDHATEVRCQMEEDQTLTASPSLGRIIGICRTLSIAYQRAKDKCLAYQLGGST